VISYLTGKDNYSFIQYEEAAEAIINIEDIADDIVQGSPFGPKAIHAIIITQSPIFSQGEGAGKTIAALKNEAEDYLETNAEGIERVDAIWLSQKIDKIDCGKNKPLVFLTYVTQEKLADGLPSTITGAFSFFPSEHNDVRPLNEIGTVVTEKLKESLLEKYQGQREQNGFSC